MTQWMPSSDAMGNPESEPTAQHEPAAVAAKRGQHDANRMARVPVIGGTLRDNDVVDREADPKPDAAEAHQAARSAAIRGTLAGGTGDDSLASTDAASADTYLFELGDGHDSIADSSGIGSIDTLRFGAGIGAAALTLP